MGIKAGSPEYKKLYNGKVIRKTNNLVTSATENLAVAAAHEYLSQVGDKKRIEVAGQGLASPKEIINTYFSSAVGDDRTSESVVVMDPNMRPMMIEVTAALKSMARDFQVWAKEVWGTDRRMEVGPSSDFS